MFVFVRNCSTNYILLANVTPKQLNSNSIIILIFSLVYEPAWYKSENSLMSAMTERFSPNVNISAQSELDQSES